MEVSWRRSLFAYWFENTIYRKNWMKATTKIKKEKVVMMIPANISNLLLKTRNDEIVLSCKFNDPSRMS